MVTIPRQSDRGPGADRYDGKQEGDLVSWTCGVTQRRAGDGKNVHFCEGQALQGLQGSRPGKRLWHKRLRKVNIGANRTAEEMVVLGGLDAGE